MVDLLKDSTTYRAVYDKGFQIGYEQGRRKAARKAIVIAGKKRFGLPANAVLDSIDAIMDVESLEQMAVTILDAESWDDVMAAGEPCDAEHVVEVARERPDRIAPVRPRDLLL